MLKYCEPNAYQLDLPTDLKIYPTFNFVDIYTYHPLDAAPISSSLLIVKLSHGEGEWCNVVIDQKLQTLLNFFVIELWSSFILIWELGFSR